MTSSFALCLLALSTHFILVPMTSLSTISESLLSDTAEWSDDDDPCSSHTSLSDSIPGAGEDICDTKQCDGRLSRLSSRPVSSLAVDRLVAIQPLKLQWLRCFLPFGTLQADKYPLGSTWTVSISTSQVCEFIGCERLEIAATGPIACGKPGEEGL